MAAYRLSKAGKGVMVLEARDRFGGRIHTVENSAFSHHVELGAEFVHGNLPVTEQLLKEAAIECSPAGGEFWTYRDGKFSKNQEFIAGWDKLMQKLRQLENDTDIGSFLDEHFGGEKYASLRTSVSRFVAGYDTADPYKASAFALRKEWQGDDREEQYRAKGGYGKMIGFLVEQCKKNNVEFFLETVIKEIRWEKNSVKAISCDGGIYEAYKAIIALPLGVLHSDNQTEGAVVFYPPLSACKEAMEKIGFGAIIKLLLEFKEPFWQGVVDGQNLSKMGFIISGEEIPTWWTQYPENSAMLTGWLGGPAAEKKKGTSNNELLQQALKSLSNIFKLDEKKLESMLVAGKIVNWTTDPFTLGSYTYDMVETAEARKILARPVEDTIYFTGEYMYEGAIMGTVEAALSSGREVAEKIL
jgi:monoamine oxidase